MGKIENKIRSDIRRTKINKAIIASLAITGGLALAVVAPNVLRILGKTFSPQRRQGVGRSFSRLIRYGYITLESTSQGKRARLTEKGIKFAALLGEGKLKPKKSNRWDKKWRILIFDIPERFRKQRDHVRSTLRTLGFYRLQDSVWVYPYDCEDLITLLKVDFKIGKNLLYIVADAVEYDKPLRIHFNLE